MGDRQQGWEGSMRLILVPVSHAAVISLHLVCIAVIHIDNNGLLEWDGIADMEAVSGAARGGVAAHGAAPLWCTVGTFAEVEAAVEIILIAGARNRRCFFTVDVYAFPTFQHPHTDRFWEHRAYRAAGFSARAAPSSGG